VSDGLWPAAEHVIRPRPSSAAPVRSYRTGRSARYLRHDLLLDLRVAIGWLGQNRGVMPDADDAGSHAAMERLFRRAEPGRGAYLSRLFAFFSEELVRHWAACPQAPYRDLGRPVIWDEDDSRYHVLDFTLERRADGARFITELKCEIEFQGYRYLTLAGPEQVAHHEGGAAFQKLMRAATGPGLQRITIGGREITINGAVLIWGAVTDEGRDVVKKHYGFAEVLSVESMVRDLAEWQPQSWTKWVQLRRNWSGELFDWLAYPLRSSESRD
jgi:hypothetical protein